MHKIYSHFLSIIFLISTNIVSCASSVAEQPASKNNQEIEKQNSCCGQDEFRGQNLTELSSQINKIGCLFQEIARNLQQNSLLPTKMDTLVTQEHTDSQMENSKLKWYSKIYCFSKKLTATAARIATSPLFVAFITTTTILFLWYFCVADTRYLRSITRNLTNSSAPLELSFSEKQAIAGVINSCFPDNRIPVQDFYREFCLG